MAGRQVPSFSRLLCSSRIFLRPPTLLLFGGGSDLASTHGLDGGASSLSSEAALTSSLLLLLPCRFSLNSGRSTMERRCWWCCWCCRRRCCRRADRSSGRLLYSGGFPLRSLALSRRVGDTRPYRVGRKVGGCTVGGGGPRTVTFLGSVPFLLRLLASRRDSGAVDDEAAGEAAEAAAAGDMDISGLLGGEMVRPQPNRPRRKLVVAERLREDLATEAGGPTYCEASRGLVF